MKLNLGSGLVKKDGYLSVDKAALEGVDVICDLFSVPWPFATSSATDIFCSHLVEHIPHEVRLNTELVKMEPSPYAPAGMSGYEWATAICQLDGFFAFFAEVWRVLVPGGRAEVVAPFGMNRMAMQDPTHTRFIVPATFTYLTAIDQAEGRRFDYQLPFRFRGVNLQVGYMAESAMLTKMLDQEADKARRDMLDAQVQWNVEHLWGQAAEVRCVLEAVKDA